MTSSMTISARPPATRRETAAIRKLLRQPTPPKSLKRPLTVAYRPIWDAVSLAEPK